MVDLRGVIYALNNNLKLFTQMKSPRNPLLEYPGQIVLKSVTDPRMNHNQGFVLSLNDDLAKAWWTMRTFCLLASMRAQTRVLLPPAMIYGTLVAVMCRGLYMKFATGPPDETMRRGLLVFTSHISLQWQDIRPPLRGILLAYDQSLRNRTYNSGLVPSDTIVWLLMIGAVSTFNISEEDWSRDSLLKQFDTCQIMAW
ncbi:hypothetical protein PG993_013037 [Apiospora rasikravindrae]|uniref:Uncharacterized protein n=1 Tax=Apiospora rasikravindrae TaxID=990691 RepID=A0ABR1RWH5_9PEZI